MKIKPGLEAEYDEYKAKNSDPYGAGVVTFERRWANAMEVFLEDGRDLAAIAEDASRIADTEGITGFMYGCAVKSLAHFWVHGEELRRWHNLKIQIHDEGERANKEGGTLNPAILVMGGGDA